MKTQEGLKRVAELKADANNLQRKAMKQMERVRFVGVDEKLYEESKDEDTNLLLNELMDKLLIAHTLKVDIQKTNYHSGVIELIQESDFYKTLCTLLAPFVDSTQKTDPQITNTMGSGPAVFQIREATFDVDKVNKLYQKAQDRIREIDSVLQELNWETEIVEEEKSTIYDNFHRILQDIIEEKEQK